MKILLTNDDGILAPGIAAMYRALTQLGEVYVVAPDSAYKHRHQRENSRSVLKLGQNFSTRVASEAANGKCRLAPIRFT